MNVRQLFANWDEARGNLFKGLDMLSDEQLSFVPREGLWSLGQVALHIANCEEGWFRFGIAHEHPEWPPAYPIEDYPTVEAIKKLLTEVHDKTNAYLETLSVDDLEQLVEAPWGQKFPLRWIIFHVFDHELHHRGEIYLMMGLLGLEGPDI